MNALARQRRRLRGQQGLTLIELSVAGAVSALVLAIVVTWIIAATRVDLDQEADFDGLNELRFAKSQMTKELRFATQSMTAANANSIEVWVDLDGSGGTGPDSPGEHVIWRILSGDLVRYTDNNLATTVTWVQGLDLANSSLTQTGNVADIELSVTVEQGATDVLELRTIKTRVTLRNG